VGERKDDLLIYAAVPCGMVMLQYVCFNMEPMHTNILNWDQCLLSTDKEGYLRALTYPPGDLIVLDIRDSYHY
jgi:hypothetical protein